MKNKLILIKLCMILCFAAMAQQMPFYTYNHDLMPINIAAIGKSYFNSNINYRAQWLGMQNAPRLYQADAALAFGKPAVGIKIYQYSIGLYEFKSATGAFIYKLKVDGHNQLFFGLGASFMQNNFDSQNAIVNNRDDFTLYGGTGVLRSTNFDCEAGLAWYGKNVLAGVSVNHLYNTNQGDANIKLNQQINLHAAYTFKIDTNFQIAPMLLARYTVNGAVPIPELMVTGMYKKMFSVGLGYRYPSSLMANAGFHIKGFKFVYSFDYGLGKTTRVFGTSHQVLLGFVVSERKK